MNHEPRFRTTTVILILSFFTCCKCDFLKIHGNYFPIWLANLVWLNIVYEIPHNFFSKFGKHSNFNVRVQQVRMLAYIFEDFIVHLFFWQEKIDGPRILQQYQQNSDQKGSWSQLLWNCLIFLHLHYVPTFIICSLCP